RHMPGYPTVPAAYILLASLLAIDLLVAQKTRGNTVPGLLIVLSGIPVYLLWTRKRNQPARCS
ncbi:MAG: hypothetical protein N3G20_01975, partial [Verrucomicrobiae bacterium]|nr:hypothetical protein [Verrucomicrobiae bacterium]